MFKARLFGGGDGGNRGNSAGLPARGWFAGVVVRDMGAACRWVPPGLGEQ